MDPIEIVTMSAHQAAEGQQARVLPEKTWEEMLAQFRALGGIAENIRMGPAAETRGLCPINPEQPIRLNVPENLIVDVGDIWVREGLFSIKGSSRLAAAEREFIESYANATAWGDAARRESAAFVLALETLPAGVRELLIAEFGMGDFFAGDRQLRIDRWLLRTRTRAWNNKTVLIPIVELGNYGSDGLAFRTDGRGHLLIEGHASDEVLINYGILDSFALFRSTGSSLAQARAYSLPCEVKAGESVVKIERSLTQRIRRGDFVVPVVKSDDCAQTFSYLLIGNAKYPRLSRGIFVGLLEGLEKTEANEVFDRIVYFNRARFLGLLAALEPHEGPMISTMRRMARHQLEAITHCIGTRRI